MSDIVERAKERLKWLDEARCAGLMGSVLGHERDLAKMVPEAACDFMDRKDAFVIGGPMALALAMVAAIRSLSSEGKGDKKI